MKPTKPKRRSPVAKALRCSGHLGHKVERDRTKYTRKKKFKGGHYEHA